MHLTDDTPMPTAPTTRTSPRADWTDVLDQVHARLAMVWPLTDYVAINPYEGLTDRNFWDARRFMRSFSNCETLPPMSHYRDHDQAGRFDLNDVRQAIEELRTDGFCCVDGVTEQHVMTMLRSATDAVPTAPSRVDSSRCWTISQQVDRESGSDWTSVIVDEIGKHCGRHYDRGQAIWRTPGPSTSLYESWRSAASRDLEIEILGLTGFRDFVKTLPSTPRAAVETLMSRLDVATEMGERVLLAEIMTVPGWGAWTKYQSVIAERSGTSNDDSMALLAMRLAYDVAVGTKTGQRIAWPLDAPSPRTSGKVTEGPIADEVTRLVALRAMEIAHRKRLLEIISESVSFKRSIATEKSPRFQMVFCIDVRSERIRRHLEACDDAIQTFGFAGFFGLPIAHAKLGESTVRPQVPALISPALTVHETAPADLWTRRGHLRDWRSLWKSFQRSCIGGFGFVESFGMTYAAQLIRRSLKLVARDPTRDGVDVAAGRTVSPTRQRWAEQGFGLETQLDLVQGILRGIGLKSFGRLVAFCGHGSQTENNPLQAGLDCGACGGHSGEFNAKVAAMLLRQSDIRVGLARRGVVIPDETVFIAMLHNTTTDELTIFDAATIPATHAGDVAMLREHCRTASATTRLERGAVDGPSCHRVADAPANWFARCRDWSEVRPEWGLAGNAAFIVGPRSMTRGGSLDGRAFLHSYVAADDPEGAVLEQIMTAPLVVAHWINQQYYASSVDPDVFGSGTKTIHNVVGKFGIWAGNGGDLLTGLPWQSVHDGRSLQHEPMRLQAIIAASTSSIDRVLAAHPRLDALMVGGWMHLVAIDDDGTARRYDGQRRWSILPREKNDRG